MSSRQREFERFIRRVRRRYLVLRLLERTGVGVLIACAAALPLLLIAMWRGQAALPLAWATLVVGALAGLLWGILTRPGELEAAMEADRQLNWADLLASALSVADRTDDPWARAVISVADLRCRGTPPRAIVLNRLGVRAWGGIGLATALVLALGVFPSYSTPAPAQNQTELSSGELLLNPRPNQAREVFQKPERRTVVQPEPEDAMSRRSSDDHASASDSGPDKRPASTDDHPQGQSVANTQSQGAGAGHTDQKNSGQLPIARHASDAQSLDATGASSGGAGRSATSAEGNGTQSGIASDPSLSNTVPPWRSADWAHDVKRAHDALDSGQVPDAYRDVVRGYFDRQ